jgi:crossover junction endodeoxyribonuclease RusA
MTKITMHLPFPPSTNSLWRSSRGRVHLSAKYKAWLNTAGYEWIAQKKHQPNGISGHFKAILILNEDMRSRKDCDNHAKAPLDLAKQHGLIVDDKLCDAILIKWGSPKKAPLGARLVLKG